jgi:hypothetical protein
VKDREDERGTVRQQPADELAHHPVQQESDCPRQRQDDGDDRRIGQPGEQRFDGSQCVSDRIHLAFRLFMASR